MIRLKFDETGIFAVYDGHLGNEINCDLSTFSNLGIQAWKIIHSVIRYIERLHPRSRPTMLQDLIQLGRALQRVTLSLPEEDDHEEWQQVVLDVMEDILTSTESRASLHTRLSCVSNIAAYFKHLKVESLIPFTVVIPRVKKPTNRRAAAETPHTNRQHIGTPSSEATYHSTLLCDVSLSRTDAEYLDEIRGELTRRRGALHSFLLEYWSTLRSHMEWGKAAATSVDITSLRHQLAEGKTDLLNLSSADGLSNLLAYIKHEYGGIPSYKQITKSEYLPRELKISNFKLPSLPELHWPFENSYCTNKRTLGFSRMRLRWLLGRPNSDDVAAMAALIGMEHPRFTPEAITFARIVDKTGRKYVQFTDNGEQFSVAKGRAHAMKSEGLSAIASEIIEHCASFNSDVRTALQEQKQQLADMLFLTFDRNSGSKVGLPSQSFCVKFLSGLTVVKQDPEGRPYRLGFWMGSLRPELAAAGLDRGTVNFRRIRCTEGVLEWFRTQSATEMSRKLGNKVRTALYHYIPPPLLLAWNTRIIRRFQNLWITVAAANQSFMLEVTDFSSLSDLNAFLANMLQQHGQNDSPLARELHLRFSHSKKEQEEVDSADAKLSVAVSSSSLTALYLYQSTALNSGLTEEFLDKADANGLTPRQFIDLATLLKSRLPEDVDASLRAAHAEAMSRSAKLALSIDWGNFFLSKDSYACN